MPARSRFGFRHLYYITALVTTIAAALAVTHCTSRPAAAAEPPDAIPTLHDAITVLQLTAPADSLRYITRWTASAARFNGSTRYVVTGVSTAGFHRTITTSGTADTFTVRQPARPGDSLSFHISVQGFRAWQPRALAVTSWTYRRPLIEPTIAHVFVRPNVVTMTAGETDTLCAFIVRSDSTISIGVPENADSLAIRRYCSGAPLTQFKSERTT